MRYAALFSGGKDSSLALWKAQSLGLNVDHLVTVYPERNDSYMFHKPNLHLIPDLAKSIGIELVKVKTSGEKEKEVEDLQFELKNLDVSGLITGAVASKYQMERIEKMSEELSLDVYAPLWNMSQHNLLEELLKNGFKTIIVSVSALGLDEGWLGKQIDESCIKELEKLNDKYGINISGEGGEYETLVLEAPNYNHNFKVTEKSKKWDGKRGELVVKKLEKGS
ncbi:MAG: TIGR00289 family protein [Candidatus Thermoplasmatota archaeon]|nr:TIGR00289 family protein [Candidatus Thermoplasmatota archaeon]MBS3790082.1 TIGR00289 family protein [Candidatus Thermoplasmatota archaeon]